MASRFQRITEILYSGRAFCQFILGYPEIPKFIQARPDTIYNILVADLMESNHLSTSQLSYNPHCKNNGMIFACRQGFSPLPRTGHSARLHFRHVIHWSEIYNIIATNRIHNITTHDKLIQLNPPI